MDWLINKIRIWFCRHEWECLAEKVPVVQKGVVGHYEDAPAAYIWFYRCKKCGKTNKVKLES